MTPRYHALVWIDHLTAKVFYVGLTGVDEIVLHSHLSTQHLHHKANSIDSGKVEDDHRFLDEVADTLSHSGQILIVGPAGEKAVLHKYLQQHHAKVAKGVLKVDNCDHPSDHQIIALAKHYFKFDR